MSASALKPLASTVSGILPTQAVSKALETPISQIAKKSFPFQMPISSLSENEKQKILKSSREFAKTIVGSIVLGALVSSIFAIYEVYKESKKGGVFKQLEDDASVLKRIMSTTSFEDVSGIGDAKAELMTLVDMLNRPEELRKLGGVLPKGILCHGPSGTGKTLLAKALAGEAGIPLYYISGSEIQQKYVGETTKQIKKIYKELRKNSPCILFIDEIDSIGAKRSSDSNTPAAKAYDEAVNQLLIEMDGNNSDGSVITMGATNRAEILDPALLRAGRFDIKIALSLPEKEEREKILKVHAKEIKLHDDCNLSFLAELTRGCSGADLKIILNASVTLAFKRKSDTVSQDDLIISAKKVMLGKRNVEKSPASLMNEGALKTTFADLGGAANTVAEMMNIVNMLKEPERRERLGITLPKGVLCYGPPGTGKTLLAKALAGETGLPFYYISAANLEGKLVGESAERVKEVFQAAKRNAPCILFIDEIDAIGGNRSLNQTGNQAALTQMLTEMDGVEPSEDVIVMGATNRIETLDGALLRPGRFDRKIELQLPNQVDRENILRIHAIGRSLVDCNLEVISQQTEGFSGADLKLILNEAASIAFKKGASEIAQEDILESTQKILLEKRGVGIESKSGWKLFDYFPYSIV
jgi:transitional endoplasmic reticulum ATPase